MKKNDIVYICSPLSAPTKEGIRQNMEKAAHYARLVSGTFGCRAIAPHSFLPEYLDDNGLSTLFQTTFLRLFCLYCTGV